MDGTAWFFDEANDTGALGPGEGAVNLNSLEMGGAVYQTPGGGNELDINVTALVYLLVSGANPVLTTFAAVSDQPVTNDATNYIYINASNVLALSIVAFPDPEDEVFYPLGIVVAAGGVITSFTDSRPKMLTIGPSRLYSFTFANLPVAPTGFPFVFVTNGVKDGETAGGGSGVLAYYDGVAWRRTADDTTVIA